MSLRSSNLRAVALAALVTFVAAAAAAPPRTSSASLA